MTAIIAFVVTLVSSLGLAALVKPKETIKKRFSPDEVKELYYEYLISEKNDVNDYKLQNELNNFCAWIDLIMR